jgi:hypothetical protein
VTSTYPPPGVQCTGARVKGIYSHHPWLRIIEPSHSYQALVALGPLPFIRLLPLALAARASVQHKTDQADDQGHVVSAKPRFERLQPHQPVDGHVEPRWVIDIEHDKGVLVDAATQLLAESCAQNCSRRFRFAPGRSLVFLIRWGCRWPELARHMFPLFNNGMGGSLPWITYSPFLSVFLQCYLLSIRVIKELKVGTNELSTCMFDLLIGRVYNHQLFDNLHCQITAMSAINPIHTTRRYHAYV